MNKQVTQKINRQKSLKHMLTTKQGEMSFADIVMRAAIYAKNNNDEVTLERCGKLLAIPHPSNVYSICSTMMILSGVSLVKEYMDFDDDIGSKEAQLMGCCEAQETIADTLDASGYWNADEISEALAQTLDLMDKRRLVGELTGEAETNFSVRYDFLKGEVTDHDGREAKPHQ